jgi:YHS domain-containing protein
MAAVDNLMERLDAEFTAAKQRVKQSQAQHVEAYQGRQQRLEQFDKTLDRLREIWRPRLEALAKKFGERVDVEPNIGPGRRSAHFEFQSELARINLRFGVMPDADVRNVVFTYDLQVVPILMKFDMHDEIQLPIDAIDETAIGKWIDDRIVSFVKTYLSLHENEYYLKDHMVQDPIAKVKFPKYAAGATLEVGGKKHYFIDESTRQQFQKELAEKK